MRRLRISALVAIVSAAGVAPAQEIVLYVDDSAPPGGDGSSWDTAFDSLQPALDAAALLPQTEIRVAQGTYRPVTNVDGPEGADPRLATFLLLDETRLMGGFAGLGPDSDDPDARDPGAYLTVLSGDLASNDSPDDPATLEDNAYHVIESWDNAPSAVVDGFVIRGGFADRPFKDGWFPNRRDDSGAGALLSGSDAVFRDCLFTDNHASANSSVWIALDGPFAYVEAGAGAVLISRGAPTFEGCRFESNSASRLGGAVGLYRSPARFTRCAFTGNRIGRDGFPDINFGGAVADASADFTTPERARFESCVFTNNVAVNSGSGGALFTIFSDSIYANCVLLANHADSAGGGAACDNVAFVEFHNAAIVGNTAGSGAGGVYEFSEVADTYLFANSIVWGNTTEQPTGANPNMYSFSGNFALYDSIIEHVFTLPIFFFDASRLRDDDPEFSDPVGADGLLYSGDENLRPGPGSRAIDHGASFRVPAWLTTDLDAKPRFIDAPTIPDTGVGPAPIVDIGPYEAGPGCSPADLAEPYATLDFSDVIEFLLAFSSMSTAADLAAPYGRLDFSDVVAFLSAFASGCP